MCRHSRCVGRAPAMRATPPPASRALCLTRPDAPASSSCPMPPPAPCRCAVTGLRCNSSPLFPAAGSTAGPGPSRQQGLQLAPRLARPPPPRLERCAQLAQLQLAHSHLLLQRLLVRLRLHSNNSNNRGHEKLLQAIQQKLGGSGGAPLAAAVPCLQAGCSRMRGRGAAAEAAPPKAERTGRRCNQPLTSCGSCTAAAPWPIGRTRTGGGTAQQPSHSRPEAPAPQPRPGCGPAGRPRAANTPGTAPPPRRAACRGRGRRRGVCAC